VIDNHKEIKVFALEMVLQWMILTYVVTIEAAVAILVTLPSPKFLRNSLTSFISLILQPALFIVHFSGFQLLVMVTFMRSINVNLKEQTKAKIFYITMLPS
jgi:hypothetical protein